MLTERDEKWIWRVNGFGAVTIQNIADYEGIDESTVARRIRVLEKAALVRRLSDPLLRVRPIAATKTGCELIGDPLRPLQGLRAGTWRHDSLMASLERSLLKRFGGIFVPERRLRMNWALDGKSRRHAPDGVVVAANRHQIAIELELTQKAPERMRGIFDEYAAEQRYDRLIYLVPDQKMADYVARFAQGIDYLHIHILKRRMTSGGGNE